MFAMGGCPPPGRGLDRARHLLTQRHVIALVGVCMYTNAQVHYHLQLCVWVCVRVCVCVCVYIRVRAGRRDEKEKRNGHAISSF